MYVAGANTRSTFPKKCTSTFIKAHESEKKKKKFKKMASKRTSERA